MQINELLKEYRSLKDEQVILKGWIRQSRFSKNVGFIELNDGSSFKNVQIVVDKNLENFSEISKLYLSSSIEVKGKVVLTENQKQSFEIQSETVHIIGLSSEDYPIQKKRQTFEYLRNMPHLRMRTNTFKAVFKVRSELSFALHKFFHENGFLYVHTPIITASDAEGAGEMFNVTTFDIENLNEKPSYSDDFFAKKSYLTVSGQLEAEAYAMAFSKVYTFGPTFRAEDSNTPRHAAEFWMVEPEIAFADLSDVMKLGEDMLKYVIAHIKETCHDELEFFNRFVDNTLIERLDNVLNSDFAKLTYTEAIEILEKADQDFVFPVKWGMDLQTEHERYLSEKIIKGPVYITDYPKDIKAFYMRLNDDNKTVAATDLLVPGVGELIGASQREEREDVLIQKIKDANMKVEEYEDYLQLRRFGGCPHGGFGLGLERAVMYITGMKNIRDTIAYPRTVNQFSKKN